MSNDTKRPPMTHATGAPVVDNLATALKADFDRELALDGPA
jgi:hypothetical protein